MTCEETTEFLDEDEEEFGWRELPDLLLEEIFRLLDPKDRHQASQVCHRWHKMFYSPRVWDTFILKERTLTRRLFNLYRGYQRELDPRKTHFMLTRVGSYFKKVIVTDIADFYNLHEFLRVLTFFLEYYDECPMTQLKSFDFTFHCEERGMTGLIVHGTGGKILEELIQLVQVLGNLRELKMNQLLLEAKDAPGLFEAIAKNCIDTLTYLEILNYTKIPCPMPEMAQFWTLSRLVVSPQQLSDEVVLLLAGTCLVDLRIVQDTYTCPCVPVSGMAWCELSTMAPFLKVRLECRGRTKEDVMVQPHAPVSAVVYSTPYSKISSNVTLDISENYKYSLQVFVHQRLPRVHGSRSFHERGDANLVMLSRQCEKLQILVVKERLSTATILLVVKNAKSLNRLYVRQNAILKKSDWPKSAEWSDEFYRWLRTSSLSLDLFIAEVSQMIGYKWRPLTDEEFKQIDV
ncbi:uncharacterized protein LOC135470209 [Liolophura sinensis]|uniref:uncharacterized protein LOC135470209 n=1 Tax=Liolophura sinensis TaxID=3198878 RepID=UPI0031585ADC